MSVKYNIYFSSDSVISSANALHCVHLIMPMIMS